MPLPPDAGAWWWVLLASVAACIPLFFPGFWLTNFYSNLFKAWFGHAFAEGLELGGLFLRRVDCRKRSALEIFNLFFF